ncbi:MULTISPECIES: RraA family protein [unclassified Paenibacillus]|uniref:RraA family protein n=1 Tax=unclassified Paenibacillus TaxID=185978 RepID=UPI001AE3BB40|nr:MULTISPECIES: RraA family protein [unclassified Paenibacillus]MBP1155410.1 regulator of RNase E activity RraA [Paenibacillus sp. PvP091]MBP1169205.1 regulator of RNase E activity RraA [Paenibacillus sp. PvR098]MBP2440233.1 regulator of RNase E activity RraA [Paenibacillus sp. PvP052]
MDKVTDFGKNKLLERLYQLDTCAVSDALDSLQLIGVVTRLHPMWQCGKIAGRVVTVKLGPKGEVQSTRHLGTAAIMSASAGDVIVVENGGRLDVAGWGGLLSTAAKLKGIAGVIVDGACRDIDESREGDFPVFARTAVPTTARGRIVEQSFNEQITVENVAVTPGDYVLADGSGIAFIPSSRAEEVITKAEAIADREREMAKAIMDGISIVDVMGLSYEKLLERKEE